MSIFIKQIVIRKMKQLKVKEIIDYASEYGFAITEKEAKQIVRYLQTEDMDPFKERDRKRMLRELAKITDVDTAKKANKLFKELIKQHGLESMME